MPRINVRINEKTLQSLQERAKQENVKDSVIVRQALEMFLNLSDKPKVSDNIAKLSDKPVKQIKRSLKEKPVSNDVPAWKVKLLEQQAAMKAKKQDSAR